jgi:predicted nucleic acid-binding protein
MPGKDRTSPHEALLYIDNIRTYLTIVALTDQEYYDAIEAYSALGITGGAIYDALIAHCALKANAKTIYTWNISDFKRLGPAIAGRLSTP